MKKVNIREVARVAGTSIASVSRYLNEKPGISIVTRNRIAETINELGYNVGFNKKKQLALILPSLKVARLGDYTITLLNAIRQIVASRGYHLQIVSREDISIIRENAVAGAISFDYLRQIRVEFPNMKNIPLVCLNDSGNALENIHTVITNDRIALEQAVEYLVGNHHRRIGFLVFQDPNGITVNSEFRIKYFQEAAKRFQISHETQLLIHSKEYTLMEAVCLLLKRKCSCLIVNGESYEGQLLHCLDLLDKRVPEDLSVITYETSDSQFRIPRQTTIAQDFPRLAEEALNLLEKMIRGENNLHDIEVPSTFVVRDSVRNLYDIQ